MTPKILMVEDDQEFLEILERRFRRRGFDVVACHSAEAALEAALATVFDAAITDRNLRGGDGIRLLKQLKQCAAELPVIILSGSSDSSTETHAIASGAASFLRKPCGIHELEAAVRLAIAHANACHPALPTSAATQLESDAGQESSR